MIGEKVLGPDHPDVGTYLSNLAGLRISQEEWSAAVGLLKRGTGIAIQASKRVSDGQSRKGQTASDAARPSDKLSLLVKAAARLASGDWIPAKAGKGGRRHGEIANLLCQASQHLPSAITHRQVRCLFTRMPDLAASIPLLTPT
jgi:hypothetical protein